MKYYLCVSYVLIGNTEGDVTETILFASNFQFQNSIASMRWYHELIEELKKIWLYMYDF